MTSDETREHARSTGDHRVLAWDNAKTRWVIVSWDQMLGKWSTDLIGVIDGVGTTWDEYGDDELGAFLSLPPTP